MAVLIEDSVITNSGLCPDEVSQQASDQTVMSVPHLTVDPGVCHHAMT